MIFEFLPWQIDIDIESTKVFYDANDNSKNKVFNYK